MSAGGPDACLHRRSLHRTSNQKIVRYEPGARLSPIWPVARYRPPIFPCSGSVAADEAPGAPESVCVADHHWPRLPWAGASDHGRSHKRHRQASDHRDREISLTAPVVPIYNTSGAKRSVGVTVWAFNFFNFIIKSSPPKTRRRRRNDVFLGIN